MAKPWDFYYSHRLLLYSSLHPWDNPRAFRLPCIIRRALGTGPLESRSPELIPGLRDSGQRTYWQITSPFRAFQKKFSAAIKVSLSAQYALRTGYGVEKYHENSR